MSARKERLLQQRPEYLVKPGGVLDVSAMGLGDATVACWVIHAALRRGLDFKVETRSGYDTNRIDLYKAFGVPHNLLVNNFPETAIGSHPPKGLWGTSNWYETWYYGWFGWPIPEPMAPRFDESSGDAAWAERFWADRDREEKATGRRVLIFPGAAWPNRKWGDLLFGHLAWNLKERGGCNVVGCDQTITANLYPYALWGQPMGPLLSLIKRADVVVGNDSGPAHMAATLGVKTVVLCGLSDPFLFFGHYGDRVRCLAVDPKRMPCVGCNFEYGRGYRDRCAPQCAALAGIGVGEVMSEVLSWL